MISRAPRSPGQQALTGAKLAFALVGVVVWAVGARSDDSTVRLIGIAFLVAAFLLRFVRRREPPDG